MRAAARRIFPGYRNFENINYISPASALVLASEYERVKVITGRPPLVVNFRRWSRPLVTTLWSIGFFEIVGFPTGYHEPPPGGPVRLLRMRSGEIADPQAVAEMIANLKGLFPGDDQSVEDGMTHLYGAMIEAVGNVCGHAYPEHMRKTGFAVGRWWMTGAVDHKNRRTTAVIYDQGVSIPVSLPSKPTKLGAICELAAAYALRAAISALI